jgi:anti-sigma factor RsiW
MRASDRRPRAPACPDEQQIAAYVDGSIRPSERETLEAHLADCAACLELVGFLEREVEASGEAGVPEKALARVQAFARPAPPAPLRHVPRWAAAAAVLAVIPVLVHLSRSTDESPAAGQESPPRVTRNAPPASGGVQVLVPAAGAVIGPRELAIRWSAVPGSAYYDVRIVTDSGAPVVEQRVIGTEWRPGASVTLQPGVEYYVRVDAYPAEGKSVGSVHVPFAVRD